jgi:hypothetical protein
VVQKFIDRNRGDDANDGSETAPWKELTKIDDAAYTAGDEFFLACDSVWQYDIATRVVPPNTWTGTRESPVVIRDYAPLSSSTGKPTIRWNRKIAANEWTWSAANNAWLFTSPYNVGFLCFVRLAGTWESSRNDAFVENTTPLDSVPGRYNAIATRFYLWAPEATDPTTYYGEVMLSLTSVGFFTISTARKFVCFQGLRFEDIGCGILGYSGGAGDTGIAVRDIEAQTCSAVVAAVSESGLGALYADIQGIRATDWGPAVVHGNGSVGFAQFDVSGCDISDGMHSHSQGAIYCQVRTSGLRPRIFGNYFNGVRWGTLDKESDGSAIYCETGSDNVDVFNNIVENAYMAFQDGSGRGNRWFNNLALNCKSFMRYGDGAGNNAIAIQVFNNTGVLGANIAPAYGSGASEIGIRGYKPTGTISSITIKNNAFLNLGGAQAAAILTPQVTPSASDYTYNAAFGNYTNVAAREYTPFTVETSTGSVTDNLILDANGRPMIGSPLIAAGVHLGYSRDLDGRQRNNPPTIGAYEAPISRTAAGAREPRV